MAAEVQSTEACAMVEFCLLHKENQFPSIFQFSTIADAALLLE